jgi:hypothetical protein
LKTDTTEYSSPDDSPTPAPMEQEYLDPGMQMQDCFPPPTQQSTRMDSHTDMHESPSTFEYHTLTDLLSEDMFLPTSTGSDSSVITPQQEIMPQHHPEHMYTQNFTQQILPHTKVTYVRSFPPYDFSTRTQYSTQFAAVHSSATETLLGKRTDFQTNPIDIQQTSSICPSIPPSSKTPRLENDSDPPG